ncbi:hypothetical protein ACN9MU_17790 [Pseudoduganella sp. R-32]|uniref:hypothetical protein n=1 Tax=Pseudoduganella sp. R-32 TaxID=3404061 RepID=UPI003CEA7EAB
MHHLLFNFLQQAGFGTMCLSRPSLPVIIVHALYVVVETAALCHFALSFARQRRQTEADRRSLQAGFDRMHRTVTEAHVGLDAISNAAHAIASGNQDLSARTEQQAAELLRTVGTVQQLAQAVPGMPPMRTLPPNWCPALRRWRCRAAPWWPRWSAPWAQSMTARAASTTSSA